MLQFIKKEVIFLKIADNLFPYFEKVGIKRKYQAQELIYMQEDDAKYLYLIIKGRVRVYDISTSGIEMTYDVLDKGRIFGESSFFQNAYRPTTVSAINDVELILCKLEDLYPYLNESKELTISLLQMMNETCNHVTKLLKWSQTYNRYEKIAAFLLDLTKQDNVYKDIIDGVIPYTHQEIASSTGLARVTVTKILNQFAKENYIKIKYGKIKVIDKEGLYQKYLSHK